MTNPNQSPLAAPDSVEDPVLFASMLATRLCHDLAGPVSAVNNGLEFFEDDEDKEMHDQAFSLLRLSAHESLTKLQMYRMAFGRTTHASETNVDEVREIVQRYFEHSKIELDWPDGPADGFHQKINNEIRQLLINAILLVSSLLVYGGTLSVRKKMENTQGRILIKGAFGKLRENQELNAILEGKGDHHYTPENITAYFFQRLCLMRHAALQFDRSAQHVDLTVSYE